MTDQEPTPPRIEASAATTALMPAWRQVLLWIVVLPGAFLGASIAAFLFNLLLKSAAVAAVGSAHPDDQSWFLHIVRGIAVSIIAGAAFVWCGARIAPRRKTVTAITLAMVVFGFSSYGGVLLIAQHKWAELLTVVPALTIGAIVAAKSVAKETVTV
jgi:hypothetical protein